MTTTVEIAADGAILVVRIPMAFRSVGGRKQIFGPDGTTSLDPRIPRPDTPLLKALGRAFRWRKMLESGDYLTLGDLAKAEGVTVSFISRILRLTLLAPDIVEAILEGRLEPSLIQLMKPFPLVWQEQRQALGFQPF